MSGAEHASAPGFVPGRHLLDSYGRGGFRFADMSHRGSILILPSGVRAWPVSAIADLAPVHLDAVFAEEVRPEFMLIGTGRDVTALPGSLRLRFREAGISLDAMQTGPAARTYNVLLTENRRVGAALIAVE